MQDFEKLGMFYLGRLCDPATGSPRPDLLLYDSKDLVTHAVCVGMTGSGKTGLCLTVLEEAAIDGVPAIAIDPKGDLANLLLLFPDLRPHDFLPWVNEDDARRQGVSIEEYAARQAEQWRTGLAEWGQSGDRIRRLREMTDLAVYTPGSNAGIPLSMVKSFAAPGDNLRSDPELLRDRVTTATSGLLSLLGIAADPLQSREHILLSNILARAWQQGNDLDLGTIIQQVQNPSIERVGVLDLESFFPAKERFAFAMQLNNLLASPGFAAWMEGEPLDVASLLHTPAGKPRIAIISIAHLDDAQRMFVVSLLLSEVLNWVRTQPGTSSLRALLYMDEIFGYFPPIANPPSKAPLLTLLKQARAFGLGVMLATQNPVDLDYKGLANAGTWFLGRMQTERDKARVLEGLEGAAAGHGVQFNRARMDTILTGLKNRVFLMNNVHEDGPVVFQVRWALSYLRGPLTRPQIQQLSATPRPPETAPPLASPSSLPARPTPAGPVSADTSRQRPLLPPDVPQFFLPLAPQGPATAELLYQPMLLGCASVQFTDSKAKVDQQQQVCWLTQWTSDSVTVQWDDAQTAPLRPSDLTSEPAGSAAFAAVPPSAAKAKNYDAWKKSFADAIYRRIRFELLHSPDTGDYSQPGESERDFRIRIQQSAREHRDTLVERLRGKYASKIATLQERIRRAELAVDREEDQARQSTVQTAISIGASLLGAFLGRKRFSASTVGKATTAARGASRTMRESGDVARARENVESLQRQLADLEAKFQAEVDELEIATDPASQPLETVALRPKKTSIAVHLVALVWAPYRRDQGGQPVRLWP